MSNIDDRVDYKYHLKTINDQNFIIIEGNRESAPLTNRMHRIVNKISHKREINVYTSVIIYKDEHGIYDRYDHLNRTFQRIGRRTLKDAINRYFQLIKEEEELPRITHI